MHPAVNAGVCQVAGIRFHVVARPDTQTKCVVFREVVDAVLYTGCRIPLRYSEILYRPVFRSAETCALRAGRKSAGLNQLCDG